GDVLEAVPNAGARDIYLLSAVLHGFDDATCVRILGNVAAACAGSGARVALLELVLPEMGVDLAAASFDMQMFMGTSGRERTLGEWRRLVGQGGFELEEVVGLQSFGNILVLRAAKNQ
ncbi:MAG: methyltransferase, partial [Mycobacterium sp.]|nr:methyltransferase [Mycobacterium sp.]